MTGIENYQIRTKVFLLQEKKESKIPGPKP